MAASLMRALHQATIEQSKLALNATIPAAWLGNTDNTAAQGDLVESVAGKDAVNGYAALGVNGKINTGKVPLSGSGTVTELKMTFPPELDIISPDLSTNVWMFTGLWAAVNPGTWFGNVGASPAAPKFNPDLLPVALMPNLDASKFTSGTFSLDRLPFAVGVGGSHASGMLPDPSPDGHMHDYLARDMTFKSCRASYPRSPRSLLPPLPWCPIPVGWQP
jgi:hypothetical protein